MQCAGYRSVSLYSTGVRAKAASRRDDTGGGLPNTPRGSGSAPRAHPPPVPSFMGRLLTGADVRPTAEHRTHEHHPYIL
jgi:hypothetical protein